VAQFFLTHSVLLLTFLLVMVKFSVRLRVSTYNKRIWWWWWFFDTMVALSITVVFDCLHWMCVPLYWRLESFSQLYSNLVSATFRLSQWP